MTRRKGDFPGRPSMDDTQSRIRTDPRLFRVSSCVAPSPLVPASMGLALAGPTAFAAQPHSTPGPPGAAHLSSLLSYAWMKHRAPVCQTVFTVK